MKIGTIRVPCLNLQAAENFYSNQLGLKKIFGAALDGFVGYELENAQLILEVEEKGEFECGRFLGFSVEVDDIEQFYKTKLEAKVKFTGEPERQAWGGMMTHIVDVSGNSFSVVQAET